VGLLTAALVLLGSAAYAHSWYPNDCCHDADCRPVPCDELVETRNGIMWRGVVLFNDAQVKVSQDRFCQSSPRSRWAHCCLTSRSARSFNRRLERLQP
jgi:hypothetical protein